MPSSSIKRRSSWLSAFVTAGVGWVGLVPLSALVLGYAGRAFPLLAFGLAAALAQAVVLRGAIRPLRMDRGIWVGALWGGITGALLTVAGIRLSAFAFLAERPVLWVLVGAYIGVPVGGFLSYFQRDDKRIEAEVAQAGMPVNYGRDAHWMEPFAYGAIAYSAAFLPSTLDLALYVFLVGAIVGVFAAGTSHFSPDRLKENALILAAIVLAGAIPGLVSGLLFRNFGEYLPLKPMAHGAIGGMLTFLLTFLRGRMLARRERSRA